MKKLSLVLLAILFLGLASEASAFYAWRYREHATDCTALTDGKNTDLCYEIDSDTFYKCEPSAGDCSGAEWKAMAGAPTTVDYLVGTASGSLSAEIAVGTSPGGELGGTWASPTIDDGLTLDAITLTGGATLSNGATSAGYADFKEDSDNGSNRVRLIGPASTADITLTLPSSDGDADQVLKTDGSGNLSWATSGGSNWTDSGTYLKPNTAGDEMQVFGSTTGFLNIGMATNQPEITYNWTGNSTTLRFYNTEYGDTKLKIGNGANDYLMIGSDSDVPFIAAPGTGYTTGIGFIGNAILPINHTGSEALGGISYSNNGEALGSTSYRWSNIYSVLGNFSGAVTASTELNVGGTDLGGRLNVDGTADERQLWIQGHSTQTNDILLVEKSDGTDLVTMNNTGDVKMALAGGGLYVKEGTNATMGVATLVAGTVTVSTTKVTANSRIFLTRQTTAGTLGSSVDVTARSAGTSFTITANGSVLDTSTVAWMIVEPS
jgi:hypothetical protein